MHIGKLCIVSTVQTIAFLRRSRQLRTMSLYVRPHSELLHCRSSRVCSLLTMMAAERADTVEQSLSCGINCMVWTKREEFATFHQPHFELIGSDEVICSELHFAFI